jgi:Cu/Ag efflux pump CusA
VLIDTPSGTQVRLGDVASVALTSDPAVITHDKVSRSLDITAEVRGRDRGDVADDVTARLQQISYPYQYRAEVVADGTDTADVSRKIGIVALVAAMIAFLLLQAATGSWRGAAVLLLCAPLAGAGGLLIALALDGAGWLAVLAAVFTVVVLAVRQTLVLVRRAQRLVSVPGAAGASDAMRGAVREKAPVVLAVVLVTFAAFLPAALMSGGAGLEFLHPFAITLVAGLITSTVVVLFLVPALYPAVGALTPPAGASDEAYAGRHQSRQAGGEPADWRLPSPRAEPHPETDDTEVEP